MRFLVVAYMTKMCLSLGVDLHVAYSYVTNPPQNPYVFNADLVEDLDVNLPHTCCRLYPLQWGKSVTSPLQIHI